MIQTAEEFLKKNGWPNPYYNFENELKEKMIEFAKFHLEEFLKSELSFTDYLKNIK